jgi:hypothetical protein
MVLVPPPLRLGSAALFVATLARQSDVVSIVAAAIRAAPQVLKGFGIPRLLMRRLVTQNHRPEAVAAAAALFLAYLDAVLNVAGHDQPVMGSMAGSTTVRRCLP